MPTVIIALNNCIVVIHLNLNSAMGNVLCYTLQLVMASNINELVVPRILFAFFVNFHFATFELVQFFADSSLSIDTQQVI